MERARLCPEPDEPSAGATMARVEIYSTMFCPYCARAKSLLEKKGVEYENIDILDDTSKRDEMVERAGGRQTVPQIFIDGKHVGGSDDLYALERAGKLDALLGIAKP
jgi:glutaredoxin 3